MAPKIDLGGAWGQKGRPSILNNTLMKIQLFCLGRCPGTQKIVTGIASKFGCDFISILTPKMGPLGLPFGTLFWSKTVREIGPGHFLSGCSPQSPPKPPKAVPRTHPGSPGDPRMAPKIDLGRSRWQKGRPSILNNTPMKIQLFDLRGCSGTPKIAPRIALKF